MVRRGWGKRLFGTVDDAAYRDAARQFLTVLEESDRFTSKKDSNAHARLIYSEWRRANAKALRRQFFVRARLSFAAFNLEVENTGFFRRLLTTISLFLTLAIPALPSLREKAMNIGADGRPQAAFEQTMNVSLRKIQPSQLKLPPPDPSLNEVGVAEAKVPSMPKKIVEPSRDGSWRPLWESFGAAAVLGAIAFGGFATLNWQHIAAYFPIAAITGLGVTAVSSAIIYDFRR